MVQEPKVYWKDPTNNQYLALSLSVILIHHSSEESTRKCLDSLLETIDVDPYEIIIVDNGSRNPLEAKNWQQQKGVRVLRSEENLGYAGGANFGIQNASHHFLLILNNDLLFTMQGLSNCCHQFKLDPEIGALSCRVNSENGNPQPIANRFNSIGNQLMEAFRLQKLNPSGTWLLGNYFNHQRPVFCDWIWGTFFLTHGKIINDLPGKKLDDQFFLYQEDVAWGWQIKKLGKKLFYYPEFSVTHTSSTEVVDKFGEEKREQMIHDNEHRFIRISRGPFYSSIFYLAKTINLLSKPGKKNLKLAGSTLRRIFTKPG